MNIVYVRVFLLAVGLASCIDAGNLTYHDVSSEEFRKMARKTYDKVIPCIESAWMMSGKSIKWEFPSDAQSHYELIKNRTGSYRSAPVHEYANYEGPWIENIFIKEFIDRPLHRFGGFIPIFVQWIDNQILRGRYFDYIHSELNELLRPNVLYLAISQGDVGLGKIGIAHPNILVLSAGGFGHVVLPLVKSIVPEVPIKEYKHDIGFYGSVAGRSTRPELLKIIRENAEYFHMTYRQGYGGNWVQDMAETKFNLAPRGYGRTSFRFAEAVQIGRIPVFVYNDHPWVPYMGSELDISNYGFVGGKTDHENTLPKLIEQLANETDEQVNQKLKVLHDIRWYFTYPGVVYEIEMFLQDPFGVNGGHLRCITHPRTERCCG